MALPATVNRSTIHTMITALLAGGLASAKVHLFTNEPQLDGFSLVDDFVEPTDNYYAAKTVTWNAICDNSDNDLQVFGNLSQWDYTTASSASEIVKGYFVTNSASSAVHFASYLDEPVTMAALLDSVQVTPNVVFPKIVQ